MFLDAVEGGAEVVVTNVVATTTLLLEPSVLAEELPGVLLLAPEHRPEASLTG